ncbi:MAG TPA: TraR/DksA C4-type zinc finger protein [Candidatus Binatia bacterium]|jgi:DnaK suppressor protein
MDTVAVKTCEEKLLKRKHEILPFLRHLEEESESAKSDFDWLDQARAQSEAHLVNRLAACFERELQGIEIALRRIRSGSFGSCRACHQPIERARLDRFPQAEFCSRCKNAN